jgi:hypothetical protein
LEPRRRLDQPGVHGKATIRVDIESEDQIREIDGWFLAWRGKLSSVSGDKGCGCCVHIWDVEGPPEVIATIASGNTSADQVVR